MPQEQEQKKEARPPREGGGAGRGGPRGDRPAGGGGPRGERPGGGGPREGGDRGVARGERGERRGFDRGRPDGPPEIDLEKLVSDSLYLDNQAHAVVSR